MEKSLAFYDTLFEQTGLAEYVIKKSLVYYSQKNNKKAKDVLKAFEKKYGSHFLSSLELANIYLEEENYKQAKKYLLWVAEAYPDKIKVKTQLAFILLRENNVNESIELLNEVLQVNTNFSLARFYLGVAYEALGKSQLASLHYLKLGPKDEFF